MNELYKDEYANTLSHLDYQFAKQHLSLKGLLKPFKDKGEYKIILQEIESHISKLENIAERLINDTRDKLPIKYLPFYLKKRRLSNGSVYLSWKYKKIIIVDGKTSRTEIEGKRLILDALKQNNLSHDDKVFIRQLEVDRLTLNFQMRVCIRIRHLINEMLPKFDELNISTKLNNMS
ncbi:hypothetical protein A9G24_03335 [Gilliamella sp. App6-5]|uniref:DUF3158 family protein n=1 Tax=Gilliamella sp. App6-5 TaxID=3120232 RepID=UPI00080DA143|nr:DUF3158 family protein [Gilliamella apicola]OCG17400.1 hypothetical protein A9G24_03335 [Gilliamella apicola]